MVAAVKGAMPKSVAIAALAIPASGFAAMTARLLAAGALAAPFADLAPALAPPLVLAYCGWALFLRCAPRFPPDSPWTVWGHAPPCGRRSFDRELQRAGSRRRFAGEPRPLPATPLWE
jgi:hypothetical protein